MKKFLVLLICFGISINLLAQTEKYLRVKIFCNQDGLQQLAGLGLAVDHVFIEKGESITGEFSETEIEQIISTGFSYEILIDDMTAFYQQRASGTEKMDGIESLYQACNGPQYYQVPNDFALGSMAGFFTYDEMLEHLDSMASKYPLIFKSRDEISDTITTIEGRPIYWVKISDNVITDETEPEVLYTALHHAREPCSMSQLIFYMYYLLENYGTDPEVTYLVDNTEIYFVPMINPDGYIYNETTDPGGGGMWRKNRRDNGDGTFGVDLNRNYGFNWGLDDNGSSPDGMDETYRGTAPFSEAETRMMRDFCNDHEFRLTLNYHAYGDLLIHPYGEDGYSLPDEIIAFDDMCQRMSFDNTYRYGTGLQTVGYAVNGDSDDWMYYEDSTKPKSYSLTPEVGDYFQGFWPDETDIIPLCIENVKQNLMMAHISLDYAEIHDEEPRFISSFNTAINFRIKKLGLDSIAAFTVQVIPLSANIISTGNPMTYNSILHLEEITDSISIAIDTSTDQGDLIAYIHQLSNNGFEWNDTVEKVFGEPVNLFSSDGSNMTGFNNTTTWDVVSDEYFSAPSSITDSPDTTYDYGVTSRIKTANDIDLTHATHAHVMFRTKYGTEARYDYVTVEASSDGGSNWISLCGKYARQSQDFDFSELYVYDGRENTWVLEDLSLDDFIGEEIQLRISLQTDGDINFDGFYFDDMTVEMLEAPEDTTPPVSIAGVVNVEFGISPNPADQCAVAVRSSSWLLADGNSELKVFDLMGKEIYATSFTADCMLPTANWSSGIYFISIYSVEKIIGKKKLVVQH